MSDESIILIKLSSFYLKLLLIYNSIAYKEFLSKEYFKGEDSK